MPRPLAITLVSSFVALLGGCAGSAPPDSKAAAQECQAGYFWNGKECEKQRTIVLDQTKPQPTSTPTAAPTAPQ